MVPTIGLMIGLYIGMRCLEMFCSPKEHFANGGAHAFMLVVAAITLLANGFCLVELLLGSGSGRLK